MDKLLYLNGQVVILNGQVVILNGQVVIFRPLKLPFYGTCEWV